MVFDLANNRYEIQDADGNVVPNPAMSNKPYRVDYANDPQAQNVALEAVDFDGTNVLWFDRMGVPYGGAIAESPVVLTSGSITVSSGDVKMTVNVEPMTGRVTFD